MRGAGSPGSTQLFGDNLATGGDWGFLFRFCYTLQEAKKAPPDPAGLVPSFMGRGGQPSQLQLVASYSSCPLACSAPGVVESGKTCVHAPRFLHKLLTLPHASGPLAPILFPT